MKTTITEALAEIATIDKRLVKKPAEMLPYVARAEQLKDPFAKTGGSEKYLAEQRQSFGDLLVRKINLRASIARANSETMIIIGKLEMSVADWLVWKRECYDKQVDMLHGLLTSVQRARQNAQQSGATLVRVAEPTKPTDVIVCLDEQQLIEEIDSVEEMYGRLDGLLSLKNATTTIEV